MDKPHMHDLHQTLNRASFVMEETPEACGYSDRHNIQAAAVLTICEDRMAAELAEWLAPSIKGKVVIEIGGGIGLLALHMAEYAEKVWCIEANPLWSSAFVHMLYQKKPKNVSYLFGAADEFAGQITGDVALFATHSGIKSMLAVGRLFAPTVIDIYGEMINRNPKAFDPLAVALRPHV